MYYEQEVLSSNIDSNLILLTSDIAIVMISRINKNNYKNYIPFLFSDNQEIISDFLCRIQLVTRDIDSFIEKYNNDEEYEVNESISRYSKIREELVEFEYNTSQLMTKRTNNDTLCYRQVQVLKEECQRIISLVL